MDCSFDWASFYALFWNVGGWWQEDKHLQRDDRDGAGDGRLLSFVPQDKGVKCKINVPDTVIFRYGQLSAWWAVNKVRVLTQRGSTGLGGCTNTARGLSNAASTAA